MAWDPILETNRDYFNIKVDNRLESCGFLESGPITAPISAILERPNVILVGRLKYYAQGIINLNL